MRQPKSPLFVLVGLVALAGTAPAAMASAKSKGHYYHDERGYGFYHIWWQQPRSDRETAFLLHAGRPQPPAWARPGKAKAETGAEPADDEMDRLISGSPGDGLTGDLDRAAAEEIRTKDGRDPDETAPPGEVYDYSPNLESYDLPEGVSKVADGRFGKGLALAGERGLRCFVGAKGEGRTFDGWFRPAELPEKPVWLMGSRRGARLYLMPDGRLRLSFLSRRGTDRRARLTSSEPIPAGKWSHVACYQWAPIRDWRETAETRIAVNGRTVARHELAAGKDFPRLMRGERTLFLGAGPDGGPVFAGRMDEIRVASRRRYVTRDGWPDLDPAQTGRPIPFGPPLFARDRRVFHADFESRALPVHPKSRALPVHPKGKPRLEWELGEHASFADYQVEAPFGHGLLVDPAMGFPRIPIRGLSARKGTFELWLQPVNWDNNTGLGEGISWPKNDMSILRFRGRDRRSGEIVTFMELELARAAMGGGRAWLEPGDWIHLVWSWSPDHVSQPHPVVGGDIDEIEPSGPAPDLHAFCFGELRWRAMIRRNVDVLEHVRPLYLEVGIDDDVTVYHGQRPAILVDELIGHAEPLTHDQRRDAPGRWHEKHGPK